MVGGLTRLARCDARCPSAAVHVIAIAGCLRELGDPNRVRILAHLYIIFIWDEEQVAVSLPQGYVRISFCDHKFCTPLRALRYG